MDKEMRIRSKEPGWDKLVEKFGYNILWACTYEFEVSASACITLAELRVRWPSINEKFIAKHMRTKLLPLAGIIAHFAEEDVYQCMPISGYSEYLTIPEGHPEYKKIFPRSYQCFAQEYSIKDFLLPLNRVEAYEKEHPELLRGVNQEADMQEGQNAPEMLQEILFRLSRLEEQDLIIHRKHYLAAILHASGAIARVSHALLSGKPNVDENGRQATAREWRNSGLEKLNFDLAELKKQKFI